MAAEWAFSYAIVFLQLLAGLALFRIRSEDRLALRIFGLLFIFNAAVTTTMTLPRAYAVWLASDPRDPLVVAFHALDAPTGILLLAFFAARSRHPRGALLAKLLVGGALAMGALEFPFHEFIVEHQWLLRAFPLYFGLGLTALVCARGRPWERWIALALLPRMLYWGTAGIISVLSEGFGSEVNVYANRLGLLALAGAAIVASFRLLRTSEDGPDPAAALPILLVGPACALLELMISSTTPPGEPFWFGSLIFVNLVTLGIVRPLVGLAGLAPGSVVPTVGRAGIAGGIAALATLFVAFPLPSPRTTAMEAVALDQALAFGFGLIVGLVTLGALEWLPTSTREPTRGAPMPPAREADEQAAPPTAEPPEASSAPEGGPHWKVLLRALASSSAPAATLGEERLTQKGLAARTGLRASRISTLVKELNASSEARLDAHVPGWRDAYRARGDPVLIEQYRGLVPGMPGVWTYYRLTPLGEALAAGRAPPLEPPEGASADAASGMSG